MTAHKSLPSFHWFPIFLLIFIFIAASGALERFGIPTIAWALIYAVSLAFVILDHKRFICGLQLAWPFLVLSGFIVLSTFWSEEPSRSLLASIQYVYTIVIAIWAGMKFEPNEIFFAILICFGLAVGLSMLSEYVGIIDPYSQLEYEGAPRYMVGIFTQKNSFGVAINFLLLAILYYGIKAPKLIIPAYILALLLVVPLIRSMSAGALIIYLATMLFPIFWYVLNFKSYRLFNILLVLTILLAITLLIYSLDLDIVSEVLSSLGKDSTLTGRSVIWDTGLKVFRDHLLFGVGYGVFWEPGVFQEVSLIRTFFHGQEITSFHNTFLEISVAIGFIGLLLFIFVLLVSIYNAAVWYFRTSSPEAFALTYMLILFIGLAFIESIMTKQHSLHTLMVVIILTISRRELSHKCEYKRTLPVD